MKGKFPLLLASVVLLLSLNAAQADQITKPHTFTAGTPASADEVNADFDTVYDQVNKVGAAISVDGAGNVGIGTATPMGELHVASPLIITGPITFTGSGLDDITVDVSGYTQADSTSYAVRVNNTGPTPNLIEYSSDGGATWSALTEMVNSGLDIGFGVTIGFAALSGHTYSDQWNWTVSIGSNDGLIVAGSKVMVQEIAITEGAQNGYVLTSDAIGNATWQVAAPDADNDPANELQSISVTGTDLTLSAGGGTVSIADNDNDPTNELNTSLTFDGKKLDLTDGNGTLSVDLSGLQDDADASPTNERNTSVTMIGTSLGVTDSGGTKSVDLAEKLGIDHLTDAKYDGSSLFIGLQAGGVDDGTNNGNVTVGPLALHANTTGYNNTATGSRALYANINGANNTATGSQSLYYNTIGSANTANGAYALSLNTTGNNNTADGYFSMSQNSSGADNTASGYNSMAMNTSAGKNTAFGASALQSQSYNNGGLPWDSYNTALGAESLYSNQPTGSGNGVQNTAVGSLTLRANTTGFNNTAVGSSALNANITGYRNTASGVAALYLNTTGNENTAAGFDALHDNTIGNNNTALGVSALANNTTAANNTAVGHSALYTQKNGNGSLAWNSYNTAVGVEALFANQPSSPDTGKLNTAVGVRALRSNTTGYENTASGSLALYSNIAGYENTAAGHRALYNNTNGVNNTAIGFNALEINTTGYYNTAVGTSALYNTVTGSFNTAIGWGAHVASSDTSHAVALGSGAIADAAYHVRIGNTSITQIGGQVGWSNLSDIRGKEEIEDLPLGLDFINALRPVQFKLKNGNSRIDFGFIAQDIEKLVGEDYNILGIGGDADRSLSLRYTDFIAPMVKAMQEQQEIIEVLRGENAAFKELLCLDHPEAAICK